METEKQDISISLLNISCNTSNGVVNSHLLPKTFQEHNIPARSSKGLCYFSVDVLLLRFWQLKTWALGRFLTIIILDLRRRKRSSDSGRKFGENWKSKTKLRRSLKSCFDGKEWKLMRPTPRRMIKRTLSQQWTVWYGLMSRH